MLPAPFQGSCEIPRVQHLAQRPEHGSGPLKWQLLVILTLVFRSVANLDGLAHPGRALNSGWSQGSRTGSSQGFQAGVPALTALQKYLVTVWDQF